MGALVRTKQGELCGSFDGESHRFAGIPFAAPPLGERRFGGPRAPTLWEGVRPAVEFGPISLQSQGASANGLYAALPADEACLTLNIWTPELGSARLPVIVFIHGGGLVALSGADPLWHGDTFAGDGIVFVTINYRLGVLGYLHLDELVKGTKDTSCNGLLDQIAALEWVHENIDAFGGDPNCVTLMGQSAGAWSVSTLIASPLTKGLFHRAIIQSGGGHHVLSAPSATRVAEKILALAGIDANIDELREVPVERLCAAQQALQRIVSEGRAEAEDLLGDDLTLLMPFLPVFGTGPVPAVPHRAVAAGAAAELDLLVGGCRDEYGLYRLLGGVYSPDQMLMNFRRQMAHAGVGSREASEDLYRTNRPDESEERVAEAIETDHIFRIPVLRMAEGHSRGPGGTYLYEFAYSGSDFGACHCIELPFVFNKPDSGLAQAMMPAGAPRELANAVHNAWISFAAKGYPEVGDPPSWPEFDLSTRKTMIFDHPCCEVQQDPRGDERAIWERVH